jgi:hypothetical protein
VQGEQQHDEQGGVPGESPDLREDATVNFKWRDGCWKAYDLDVLDPNVEHPAPILGGQHIEIHGSPRKI